MAASARHPLVAGNWKMNGLASSLAEVEAISAAVDSGGAGRAETLICPPFTLIGRFAEALRGGALRIGAQDCSPQPSGAYTGDISAEMLLDAGASHVIVGHSERRTNHGEDEDRKSVV